MPGIIDYKSPVWINWIKCALINDLKKEPFGTFNNKVITELNFLHSSYYSYCSNCCGVKDGCSSPDVNFLHFFYISFTLHFYIHFLVFTLDKIICSRKLGFLQLEPLKVLGNDRRFPYQR